MQGISPRSFAWVAVAVAVAAGAAFWLARPKVAITVLYSFNGHLDGRRPSGLLHSREGVLYGVAKSVSNHWGGVFRLATNGTLDVVLTVDDYPVGLVETVDGRLYGVAYWNGEVVMYRLGASEEPIVIHSFGGWGEFNWPVSLVPGREGQLYGMTRARDDNYGAVIRVTSEDELELVYEFDGSTGRVKHSGLLLAHSDGFLYGLADGGGAENGGTFFQLATDGNHRLLHSFPRRQGMYVRNLVEGPGGRIFGITETAVFRIHSEGAVPLFQYYSPGGEVCALVRGGDGMMYVTTIDGRTHRSKLWRMRDWGPPALVYTFRAQDLAVQHRYGPGAIGLVSAGSNEFYGISTGGGDFDWGTIFHLTVRR